MRIAFLTHYCELYGANRSLLDLIRELKKRHVESCVLIPKHGALSHELSQIGVPTILIPYSRSTHYLPDDEGKLMYGLRLCIFVILAIYSSLKNMLLLPILTFKIRTCAVDIVYTNSSVLIIGWFAARLLGKPHIFHIREFIDKHYRSRPDIGASITHAIYRNSDAKIATSAALARHLFDDNLDGVHIVYNGVLRTNQFDEVRQSRKAVQPDGFVRFVIVGLIHRSKKQDDAVKALAIVKNRYPNVRLSIIGGNRKSTFSRALTDLVNKSGLANNIDFHGYLENPFAAYSAATATLICSRYEGFGRVAVEAMAAGCPVIGHKSGGTAEIIDHGRTGLLYSTDYTELAKYMINLIEDPKLAKVLADNAWSAAKERFNTEKYGAQIFHILADFEASAMDVE